VKSVWMTTQYAAGGVASPYDLELARPSLPRAPPLSRGKKSPALTVPQAQVLLTATLPLQQLDAATVLHRVWRREFHSERARSFLGTGAHGDPETRFQSRH